MKVFLFCLLFSISKTCLSQQIKSKIIANEIYEGQLIYSNSYHKGFYIFKEKNIFFYIEMQDRDSTKIKKIGKGKWNFSGNQLSLGFLHFPLATNDSNLTDIGKSKSPYDSTTIMIKVVNHKNEPLSFASVFFGQFNNGGLTDSLGLYNRVFNIRDSIKKIIISSVGYLPKQITVCNSFNFHQLTIVLSPEESFEVELVKPSDKINLKLQKEKGKTLLFSNGQTLTKKKSYLKILKQTINNFMSDGGPHVVLLSEILTNLSASVGLR
ncbi:MAG: hypothetical protein ACKVOM_02470 [Ferruginibacter sp.]